MTEYGVHWNFFFTLCALPLVALLVRRHFKQPNFFWIGALVVTSKHSVQNVIGPTRLTVKMQVHQILLTFGGLQNWTMLAPRTSILSANKEGISSLPGGLLKPKQAEKKLFEPYLDIQDTSQYFSSV